MSNAKPHDLELAERMLVLTLALEVSLAGERYAEAEALLIERDQCLTQLEQMSRSEETAAMLGKVRAAESRLMGMLSDLRSNIARDLQAAIAMPQLAKKFQAVDTTTWLDQVS